MAAIHRPLTAAFAAGVLLSACGSDDSDNGWGQAPGSDAGLEETTADAAAQDGADGSSDATADTIESGADVGSGDASDSSNPGTDGSLGPCSVLGVPGDCLDTDQCAAIPDHASSAGFCSGPSEIQCCTPCGLALCDPDVPQYPNDGKTLELPGQGGCPPGMIPVASFCVDQYEASLVEVGSGASWSPYLNPGASAVRAVSVEGAVPQGYINQEQAAAACANSGKRLCTDAEWLRACQGPDELTCPYGDTRVPGVCNDHRSVHPAIQYFGTDDDWIWSEIGNACINQLPQSVEPAGARQGCVTAESAFDMMGNLHEWTADPAGTFRGGFYVDTVLNGIGCLYATTAHNTLHWDYSTGFRCCAE